MASNPENVRSNVLMKLQEAFDEEAILEEQILTLMHRFADRFTDRRVEINNLMVLQDHPLIDYAIDRDIMENVNEGNMLSNIEQSAIYSEIFRRVKDALHHEAQGGLPSLVKDNSFYPSDNLKQKGDKATTQISPVRASTLKSKTNKHVECHPICSKALRFAKIIQDKKSSLKSKERDKTKVIVRNNDKSKEKYKKRICKEANEDFNVSPHVYDNLTEYEDGKEDDEEDDEYQNNLNLIGVSLGITLYGKPARPITDVFGDFLHDTNRGDPSPFIK
nr:hypothetical protein [Tanacetum cinerariifolium]